MKRSVVTWLSVALMLCAAISAQAATYIWTQTAGGAQAWTTGGNWSGGSVPSPVSGDTIDLSTVDIAANTALTLGTDRTATTWNFGDTSGAQNWIISSGSKLVLAGTTPTINVAQNTVTINAVIDGAVGLTKTGSGTLTLTGANTYSGTTTHQGGTLVMSGSSSATSGITLNNGSGTTLLVTSAGATGNGNILMNTGVTTPNLQFHIDGGGTIALPNAIGGNSSIITTIDVNNNGSGSGGVIQLNGSLANSALGNDTLNITGDNEYSLYIANIKNTAGSAGTIKFNPTTASLSLGNLSAYRQNSGTAIWELSGTNRGNSVTGVISDKSGVGGDISAVTKSDSGTWTLSGANTYTGATTIKGGVLALTNTTTFVSPTTISGGQLLLQSATAVQLATITNGVSNGGLGFSDATNAYTLGGLAGTGNVALTNTAGATVALTLGNNNVDLTYGGTLSQGGSLTKVGSGRLILSGPNTYTGGTIISNGVLQFNSSSAIGGSGANVTNYSVVAFGYTSVQSDLERLATFATGTVALAVSSADAIDFNSTSLSNVNLGAVGSANYTGIFTPYGTTYRLGGGSGILTYQGAIGGSSTLVVGGLGGGTVVLTAASTFSGGTTINGGTLQLSGGDDRLLSAGALTFNGNNTILDLGSNSQTLSNISFTAMTQTNTIQDGSTLTINGIADFRVGSTNTAQTQFLTLSGVDNFTYNSPTKSFSVGGQETSVDAGSATLTLAATNMITALRFGVADVSTSATGANAGTVHLGQVNTVSADTIYIAATTKALGSLDFITGLTNPSLKIRGTDGSSRVATMIIGQNGSGVSTTTGTLNLANGVIGASSVDALISTLTLGLTGNGNKSATGTVLMSGGIFDATTIVIGRNNGNSTGAATGLLSLNGGTNKVQTLMIGDMTGTGGAAVNGTYNLVSGTLLASNIKAAAGAATRVFNWTAGTIQNYDASTDLTITNLSLNLVAGSDHIVGVEAGRQANIYAALTNGGNLVKSGNGTMLLFNNNTYAGATIISNGTLLVNGDQTSANGAVTVASGATLGGSGTIGGNITINDGGTLNPGARGTPAKLIAKGNVSFSGSAPVFTITTSGATYDQVDCASTAGKAFTCTNGRLSLPGAPPTGTGSIKIVVNAANIDGQFSNASGIVLGENASLSSYTGWSGWYVHYRASYVELNQSATPVVLLQLQALTLNGQVTVWWSTSSESKTAGFDLYRVVNGQPVKLNDAMIAAKGWPNGGVGASYRVADASAQPGQTYTYKLVERTTDGQSIDYGPYDRTVSEFLMKPLVVTAAGIEVHWLSRDGESYRVLKCTNLSSGQYQPIAENVTATPPENEYLDATPGNSGFYRIELQQ